MLPRRQIREEFYRLFGEMSIPKTISKGRIHRYLEQDLPAINVNTFSDQVLNEERVHGIRNELVYAQSVVVELHMPVKDNFEDELDDLEEEFWSKCSAFNIAGVEVQYDSGDLAPIGEVDNPHATKLLNFTARYSVDSHEPNTIL